MNLSHPPFDGGCTGVIFKCSKPISTANAANSADLKHGPLSDFTRFGLPNCLNMSLNTRITFALVIPDVNRHIGYLENSSYSTKEYIGNTPFAGNLLVKSMDTKPHGASGNSVGLIGGVIV